MNMKKERTVVIPGELINFSRFCYQVGNPGELETRGHSFFPLIYNSAQLSRFFSLLLGEKNETA